MSGASTQIDTTANDIPIVSSNHTQQSQGALEKLEHMYNSFQYGMAKGLTDGLDGRLSSITHDFKAGQTIAQQGEAAMMAYMKNTQQAITAMLDANSLDKVKLALEQSAERMHAAYARGDYHEMGSLTGALVVASIDPDKLKQLKRLTDVADGVKHVDDVAAGTVKNIDNIKDGAPELPKPYAHDMEPSKVHDPDLMRGRQSGPVTIGDTVYESGQAPRKLGPDEKPPLSLVEKEEADATEVLKPRQHRQSQNVNPVKPEDESLALATGVGITTLAGLAFGAIRYYEMQHAHRRELSDAYNAAVNMNDYADNPQDRLSRYTATVQKYPELENAIKLFEGARVAAAKDGFTYQEIKALEQVVANTKESIRKNELGDITVPDNREVNNQQLELSQ